VYASRVKHAHRWLPYALGLWAVGVQMNELFATLGAWATAVLALTLAWPLRAAGREWWPLFGFLAWSTLAPLLAGHPPTATGLARLSDFLLIPAAAYAVSQLEARALTRIGLAAAATLGVSLGFALLQHFGVWPSAETVAAWPWHPAGFRRVYETLPGRGDRFMAGGLLLHRLKFANVTAALCVLGAAAVVLRAPRWRLFAFATGVGLLGVWVFPHARAASVAAVLSVCVVWVAGAQRRRAALLGASALVALALVVALAVPSVRARFENSLTGEGSGDRTWLTQAGLNAVVASPVVGVGPGRFRPGAYLPADAPAQARDHVGKAHDQFVTIAAEAGLPAAVLVLWALGWWAVRGARSLPGGAALMGAVALFILLGLLHDPLFHAESSLALMLVLGASVGVLQRRRQGSP
jgi:O-antigen ligase